jgi:uncharacterized protein
MTELPLFPLRAVLFPRGRMPLRIFEPRYVDLVSDCFKHGREFGVVWIREGGEVVVDADHAMPKLAQIGCTARIVDWDAMPNGSFGITIEGGEKFRVLATQQRPNFLVVADIETLPAEESLEVPAYASDMIELLRQLMMHPAVSRLNIEPQSGDAGLLANQLAQLLPIPEAKKFELLAESHPQERLDHLLRILEQISP